MKKSLTIVCLALYVSTSLFAQEVDPVGIRPNGQVFAIDSKDGILYLGGSFKEVGYLTGAAALLPGPGSEIPDLDFPNIKGQVYAILPDGSGGWYVAGDFNRVGLAPRDNIAHILPNFEVDPDFNLSTNQKVNALAIKDNILYLGGRFTQVNNTSRSYVAAYNLTTNALTNFNPAPNQEVFSLEVYNDQLILGGFFSQVGGVNQPRLARVNLSTGANVPIITPPVGFVYDLLTKNDTLFVAGSFLNCLMAINLTSNQVISWPINFSGFGPRVNSMTLVDSVLYLGGSFNGIKGESRKNVAGISLKGNVTPFQPDPDAEVFAVYQDGDSLYIGGDFKIIANADLPHAAKIAIKNGQPSDWRPDPEWAIRSFLKNGNDLVIGGEIEYLHGAARDNACAINIATGELTDWNPQTNFLTVTNIKTDPLKNAVYLTGWDSQSGKNFKAFDLTNGELRPGWDLTFNNAVNTFDIDPATGDIYLGGEFTTINGQPYNKFAKINANGNLVPINVSVNDPVDELVFSPDHNLIYFSGNFETVNGTSRYKMAAINPQGQLQSWYPRIDSLANLYGVFSILPASDRIFLAGNWNHINGVDQENFAAVHPTSGALLSFNPQLETNSITHILKAGNGLFIRGDNLLKVGNIPVKDIAYIGAASGQVLIDIPDYEAPNQFSSFHVWRVDDDNVKLFVGGTFQFILQKYHPYLAGLNFKISNSTIVNDLIVEKSFPDKGGNTGSVTVEIIGKSFTSNTQVKLTGQGFDEILFEPDSSFISDNKILAHFNLRGASLGPRDLAVMAPDGQTVLLGGAFTIEPGTLAETWADVVIPDFTVTRKEEFFYLTYGNSGNIDAVGVPIWLAVSPNIEVKDFGFKMFDIVDPNESWYDSIPEYILVDTLAGKYNPAKVYGFIIPKISAGSSQTIRFTVQGENNGLYYARAWAHDPFFGSPLKYLVGDCADAWISNAIGFVPVAGCVYNVADVVLSPIFDYMYDPEFGTSNWSSNYSQLVMSTVAGCAAETALPVIGKVAVTVLDQSLKLKGTFDLWDKCLPALDLANKEGEFVSSLDPNDKTGLKGRGAKGWIRSNQRFPYMIRYENDPEATAPAKEVIIRDTLDLTVYDLSTLQLKGFAIADSFYVIPSGYSEYTMEVDLRPRLPYLVESDVKLNSSNGLLTWKFTTLDPVTRQLVTAPLGGYLPPNKDTLSGQGAIFFDIALYDTLSNGREVKNKAAIYFDFNDPIITNTWINTIDNGGLNSKVSPLSESQAEADISLQWSGTDEGSGIIYYDVLVRKDNGPWGYAAIETNATSMVFPGEAGSTYEFYTIAYDSALNREAVPLQADARVQITNQVTSNTDLLDEKLHIYPNPAGSVINLHHSQGIRDLQLKMVNLQGQTVLQQHNFEQDHLTIHYLPAGIYIINWQKGDMQGQQKLVKR